MNRVGIRELRQNLSVHLRRVKQGESLEVTDHGTPVAVLAPLPEGRSTREVLIASGKIEPAARSIGSLAPPTPVESPAESPASDALADQRDERL